MFSFSCHVNEDKIWNAEGRLLKHFPFVRTGQPDQTAHRRKAQIGSLGWMLVL